MERKNQMLSALGEGVTENFDPALRRAFDVADNEVSSALKDPEKLKFHEGQLKLSGDGIFYTLQGEGPTMGEPATFVRTHICNLACSWCDAYYTWNPKSEEFWTEPRDVDIKQVADEIRQSWQPAEGQAQKRVVFTGGEPLIQQKEITNVVKELGDDWKVEIETNGTIMPNAELLAKAQFNCSPKLENSDNSRRARIRPEVVKALAKANTTFKFVVMKPEELDEIQRDYIEGAGVPHNKVILMPQGVTPEETQANMVRVADYAKEKGFRMLGRLQVSIWGAVRKR